MHCRYIDIGTRGQRAAQYGKLIIDRCLDSDLFVFDLCSEACFRYGVVCAFTKGGLQAFRGWRAASRVRPAEQVIGFRREVYIPALHAAFDAPHVPEYLRSHDGCSVTRSRQAVFRTPVARQQDAEPDSGGMRGPFDLSKAVSGECCGQLCAHQHLLVHTYVYVTRNMLTLKKAASHSFHEKGRDCDSCVIVYHKGHGRQDASVLPCNETWSEKGDVRVKPVRTAGFTRKLKAGSAEGADEVQQDQRSGTRRLKVRSKVAARGPASSGGTIGKQLGTIRLGALPALRPEDLQVPAAVLI